MFPRSLERKHREVQGSHVQLDLKYFHEPNRSYESLCRWNIAPQLGSKAARSEFNRLLTWCIHSQTLHIGYEDQRGTFRDDLRSEVKGEKDACCKMVQNYNKFYKV